VVEYPAVFIVQHPTWPSGHDPAIVPWSDAVHASETADSCAGSRLE
jgi:hypothetical protein